MRALPAPATAVSLFAVLPPPLTVPARGAYYARPRHAPGVSQGCKMFPVLLPMRRACAVRFPDPAHLWTAIGPSGCSPGAAPTPAARPPCADPTSSACPLLCRFFGIYPKCCTRNCCPPLLRQSCAACPALAVPCVTTRPFHLSPDRRGLHAVAQDLLEQQSRAIRFHELRFTPTSPFSPDESATSAFPSLGPPFSPVHARHSPPPQSPFSPALTSPYPRDTPYAHPPRPSPYAVRPPAAAATQRRARIAHALAVRAAPPPSPDVSPMPSQAQVQVQPGQALMLPSLTHMYKCSLSASCRARSALSPSPSHRAGAARGTAGGS
ncbi:hypothetical protein B0H14DRAFT_3485049 [Mycena olivaceomarginata]|nr:hypothetical protein B0H14DRAFT_3485049 [Mycena olivaceomarginata]